MSKKTNSNFRRRQRRKMHIRKTIRGTAARPRMAVFRSDRHVYVQVIDDVAGVTIASASTLEADFKGYGGNTKAAAAVGKAVAEKAKSAGVSAVVFDRGGYLFHGRVKALADAAREAGLTF